nr:polysaccharide deacetylase family protein [Lachnospiraceae bacterium]
CVGGLVLMLIFKDSSITKIDVIPENSRRPFQEMTTGKEKEPYAHPTISENTNSEEEVEGDEPKLDHEEQPEEKGENKEQLSEQEDITEDLREEIENGNNTDEVEETIGNTEEISGNNGENTEEETGMEKNEEISEPKAGEKKLSFEDVLAEDAMLRSNILNNLDYYESFDNTITKETWCYNQKKQDTVNHLPPRSYQHFDISKYDGYYINPNLEVGEKVIYLGFDCGSSTEYTDIFLEALAKHNATACFFVTTKFMRNFPQSLVNIAEAGHVVGNHTTNHLDLRKLSSEKIIEELQICSEYYFDLTGKKMDPFFRPPGGAYTERTMKIIQDLGYSTIFWSWAYRDWDDSSPVEPGVPTELIKKYYHPGMVLLMHVDCYQNGAELDEILTFLEGEGYRIGSMYELIGQ